MTKHAVVELIGVYHADGGPIGEAKYVIGKFLGRAHCPLCDITHSPVRRKPEWDQFVASIGIPFALVHLNEMPPTVASAVAVSGSPVILARMDNDEIVPLLRPHELDLLDGSVTRAEVAIREALKQSGTESFD